MKIENCVTYAFAAVLALAAGGCGAPIVLPDSAPVAQSQPLVDASDSRVAVSVNTIVVRNGAGSWVRDAPWDEYRFRIRSCSGRALRLEKITLVDALDHPV